MAADYEVWEDACVDSQGRHNRTYFWRQPKACDDGAEGSVSLPASEVAGPCSQQVEYVASRRVSGVAVLVLVMSGVGVVMLSGMLLLQWVRSRELYEKYSQLVAMDEQVEREAEMVRWGEREEEDEGEDRRIIRSRVDSSAMI